MTKEEWLVTSDVATMLQSLDPHKYDRKLRLFACACCYRIWKFLDSDVSRELLDVSERFADGKVAYEYLEKTVVRLNTSEGEHHRAIQAVRTGAAAFQASYKSSAYSIQLCAKYAADAVGLAADIGLNQQFKRWSAQHTEEQCQRSILTDIIPFPEYNVDLDSSWFSSTAVAIAQGIYDDKSFDRLPILADALQDAGCEDENILNHLRSDGSHVRGCWALDLVLGKE
ncbi:hypothetical protein [Limnoglobus roseus]|uniref:SMI1/KNR4 family protein n=1 Tax=Limnoglobus roseus TaxID=2598579 RepID=A0A5C1A5B9_9BACT|nr:hypothetical protein [Limnoglobus roseus]QEL13870.1 SMI1/KNR4 family protein [Limnoglobus roseus]